MLKLKDWQRFTVFSSNFDIRQNIRPTLWINAILRGHTQIIIFAVLVNNNFNQVIIHIFIYLYKPFSNNLLTSETARSKRPHYIPSFLTFVYRMSSASASPVETITIDYKRTSFLFLKWMSNCQNCWVHTNGNKDMTAVFFSFALTARLAKCKAVWDFMRHCVTDRSVYIATLRLIQTSTRAPSGPIIATL